MLADSSIFVPKMDPDSLVKVDFACEFKKQPKNFKLEEYLLLGGGPTNLSPRVQRALGTQCLNPVSTDMIQLLDEVKIMTQYLFQTKNRLTLAIQNSGNGGNEAILFNLLDPGDRIVIAIGGTWGDKVLDMAQRHHLNILPLRKPPGEVYSIKELEDAIVKHKADLLFVTHGESTGGTLQNVTNLGSICHKHNCLLGVDAVVSIAVDPLFVDRWEIDAVTAGSQKAIGAPPGMCLMSFSDRAIARMRQKKTKTPYYFDILRLGLYWKCFDEPRDWQYTFSSNLVASVREALAQISEEGLLNVWARHKKNTQLFWKKLDEIGLECLVEKPENRFHGVTCVMVPKGIDQMQLLAHLKNNYKIDITPGHGPSLNKAMRIGLMGFNSTPEVVEYLINALKESVQYFRGYPIQNNIH